MSGNPPDPQELGYFFSLAQVGLEMVVPVVAGLFLDRYFNCGPWGVVGGAVVGLVVGLVHLVTTSNRPPNGGSSPPKQGSS